MKTAHLRPPSRYTRARRSSDSVLTVLRRRFGWYVARQVVSHVHLKHPDRLVRVTVPVHTSEILKPKTLAGILDQAGIELDEFTEML